MKKYNRTISDQHKTSTKAVRAGTQRTHFAETSEALFLNSGYVYEDAQEAAAAFREDKKRYMYSRFGNPTVSSFQDRLKALENAKYALATGTGMSAIFLSLAPLLKSGDRVVSSYEVFSSSYVMISNFFKNWNIEYEFVNGSDIKAWENALSKPTKAVLIETPSNPLCSLVDIAAVAKLSKKAGAKLIVDNAFATPIAQNPLNLGADIVIHSATKLIDGQGRVLGGALLTNDEQLIQEVFLPFYKHLGLCLSAFDAWVLLKGLETLKIRVEHQSENARFIAEALEKHPKIERVYYPGLASHDGYDIAKKQMKGFGNMLAFSLKSQESYEDQADDVVTEDCPAFQLMNALQLIDISNNLGDTKSLICHPATTTHRALGQKVRKICKINFKHIRLNVGLEDRQDVLDDLEQALKKV